MLEKFGHHKEVEKGEEEKNFEVLFQFLNEGKERVRRFSKICLIVGGLLTSGIVEKTQAQEVARPGVESVDSLIEHNRSLLRRNEYIVSQDVMRVYTQTVDPRTFGMVSGGFFQYDYLDTRAERRTFSDSLKVYGYSNEEIQNFRNLFKDNNIVFNEAILRSGEFMNVLQHERMHKYITELSREERTTLNEARDSIISDYNQKHELWVDEEENLLRGYHEKYRDNFNYEESRRVTEQINNLIRRYNPILRNGLREYEFNVQVVLERPDEFYPYLLIQGLNPEIESYIQTNFPEAFMIYKNLETTIRAETTEINSNP